MKKDRHAYIVVSLVIIGLAVAAALVWRARSGGSGSQNAPVLDASTTAARANEAQKLPDQNLSQTYANQTYGFSLKYLAGLKTREFADPSGTGDVVLIADFKTGYGMQILITPWTGPADLTADYIKTQLPNLQIVEPQTITVGSTGRAASGVSFMDGTGSGANRQIWFAHGGDMYQITSPADFDPVLRDIMGTWTFDE